MIEDLNKIRDIIETMMAKHLKIFGKNPFLFKRGYICLCALDMAYTDFMQKKSYMTIELYYRENPLTDYTIGIASIEKMVSKMKELPWPIYKIKLGTHEDIAIVTELRKHTDAIFRIDANCGWGVEETINNAIELKKLGVEFLEQPMKADNWEGHKEVFKHSVLPIIADESCIIEEDVAMP
jgi:L-alanine-DL-glutamate epimerase-like enolase superfamily enzyme